MEHQQSLAPPVFQTISDGAGRAGHIDGHSLTSGSIVAKDTHDRIVFIESLEIEPAHRVGGEDGVGTGNRRRSAIASSSGARSSNAWVSMWPPSIAEVVRYLSVPDQPGLPNWCPKQAEKARPKAFLPPIPNPLNLLGKTGAGEGIRTLDPNLGKVDSRDCNHQKPDAGFQISSIYQ